MSMPVWRVKFNKNPNFITITYTIKFSITMGKVCFAQKLTYYAGIIYLILFAIYYVQNYAGI